MAISAELRGKIQIMAAELRQCLYGPKGCPEWGTKFAQIEEDCCEVGDALTVLLMQQAAAQQAEETPASACVCSMCGEPTQPHPDDPLEPHPLQTSRGDVAWQEPKRYCRKCRQAFFPSELRLGPGHGNPGQPQGVGEDGLGRNPRG